MDAKPPHTNILRLDVNSFSGAKAHLAASIREALDDQGCFVIEPGFDAFTMNSISALINKALKEIGIDHACDSPEASDMLQKNKHMQSALYDRLISLPEKNNLFSTSSCIQSVVSCLFDEPVLYEKSPLRVDVPFDLREMTLWHQDFFYVKGSVDVVTFYMPLNDLDYLGGALSVCPGSHKSGPLPHALSWGKKSYPNYAGSLANVCCELRAGSALVFNSLLLHQTNPNYSELVNFNIQYRVSGKRCSHNPQMGNLIPIPNPSLNSL